MKRKNTFKGFVFLFGAAIVWGGAFVAQCVGADKISTFLFNGVRFLVGALALLPVIAVIGRKDRERAKEIMTIKVGVIGGLLLSLASNLQQYGILLTDSAGKSGFLTGLYMILVPILGIFLGKKTTWKVWLGAVFGVGGLFLICTGGTTFSFSLGDLVLILDAFIFAAHIILIDSFSDRIYALRFSFVQFMTVSVTSLFCALLFEDVSFAPIKAAAIPILYCGLLSVGVGYSFQTLGQKYSEPTTASIILSTESVFSAILGAIILSERMTPVAVLGCVLIFAGIVITQHPDRLKLLHKKSQ